MFLHQLYLKLPPSIRQALKDALRSNGHSSSVMDPLIARKDALGKKRLDRSLRQLIEILGVDGARQLNGRVCVEFGAGYIPMDAISMWLLGAKSVVAIDYNDIGRLRTLRLGIAKADMAVVRGLLADIAPKCDWNARLQALEVVGSTGYARTSFSGIPLRYIAPLDVIADPQRLPEFDFLWSISVLEHVVPSRMTVLLRALNSRAADAAVHVHRVDLRDHRDFDGAPYGFLDPTASFDPESESDFRGNGMSLDAWECTLAELPELGLRVVTADRGEPSLVPLDPSTGNPVVARVADWVTIGSVNFRIACRTGSTAQS